LNIHRFFSFRAVVGSAFVALALALAIPAGAAGGISVSGGLTLDSFGNKLSIAAQSTGGGAAIGEAVLQSGTTVIHNPVAPEVIRIRITCMIPLSDTTVIVGGETEGATVGLGTVDPFYSFVLEDGGVGQPDKWTIFAQVSGVCTEAFGPANETAVAGNIVIHGG
jgi:hypothetical protein